MNKKLPAACPCCNNSLKVSELFCPECETKVSGTFELPLLAQLTEKEQTLILDFVKASGNIKEIAKNMGLSYPTVRNILDELIDKLNKIS